jgi:hypothetical protein
VHPKAARLASTRQAEQSGDTRPGARKRLPRQRLNAPETKELETKMTNPNNRTAARPSHGFFYFAIAAVYAASILLAYHTLATQIL